MAVRGGAEPIYRGNGRDLFLQRCLAIFAFVPVFLCRTVSVHETARNIKAYSPVGYYSSETHKLNNSYATFKIFYSSRSFNFQFHIIVIISLPARLYSGKWQLQVFLYRE